MSGRVLVLLLLVHVTLDFVDPTLPGVFRFDPQESIDAVGKNRTRLDQRPGVTGLPTCGPHTAAVAPRVEGVPARPQVFASSGQPAPLLVLRPSAPPDSPAKSLDDH